MAKKIKAEKDTFSAASKWLQLLAAIVSILASIITCVYM